MIVAGVCLTVALPNGIHFAENEWHALDGLGQAPTQIGGSFMVAVVCKDGILVAADSRGTIEDDRHRRLAYYDGVQKVFPLGNNAMAYTGADFIQNLHFSAWVRQFSKVSPAEVGQVLPAFLQFSGQLPEEARAQVRKQHVVVAGYTEGRPSICYFNEAQSPGPKYSCDSSLVSSDRTTLNEYVSQLLISDCTKAASLVKKAIKRYSREHPEVNIGGPIYIRLLTPQGSRWLGDAPRESSWTYLHDFAADYREGKITLTLLPGVRKSELDQTIRKGESWSRQGRRP